MTYLSDDSEESYRSLQRFFRNNSEASSAIDCWLFPVMIIDGWDVVGAVDWVWLILVVLTVAVVIGIIEISFSCNAAFGWSVLDVGIIYFTGWSTSMCALQYFTLILVCVCMCMYFVLYKKSLHWNQNLIFIKLLLIFALMFYCCFYLLQFFFIFFIYY